MGIILFLLGLVCVGGAIVSLITPQIMTFAKPEYRTRPRAVFTFMFAGLACLMLSACINAPDIDGFILAVSIIMACGLLMLSLIICGRLKRSRKPAVHAPYDQFSDQWVESELLQLEKKKKKKKSISFTDFNFQPAKYYLDFTEKEYDAYQDKLEKAEDEISDAATVTKGYRKLEKLIGHGEDPESFADNFATAFGEVMCENKTPQQILKLYDKLIAENGGLAYALAFGESDSIISYGMATALENGAEKCDTRKDLEKAIAFLEQEHPLMRLTYEEHPYSFCEYLHPFVENIDDDLGDYLQFDYPELKEVLLEKMA